MVYVLYFTNKIESTHESDGLLTRNEKVSVIITALLSPLVAQAFYYYCWKNKFPKRASQANKYGWVVFGVEILLLIVVFIVVVLAKTNANAGHR